MILNFGFDQGGFEKELTLKTDQQSEKVKKITGGYFVLILLYCQNPLYIIFL